MAKYRHVRTEFWQDPKVLEEMTPEDRYFYLYLLTNPFTSQIGIYSITKKQMAFDIGHSIESINSLMDRFQHHHHLVEYNPGTREIAILKWGRYNLNKAGKPMLDCIEKELREVKDRSLIELVYPHIPNESIRELFSRYVDDTCHDTSTSRGQKEKEKEKEKEKNIYVPKLKFEDVHMNLAKLLFSLIQRNNPKAKVPNLEKWANRFRLMMENREQPRTYEEIKDMIIWTQNHDFWFANILSADKLNQKFDDLTMQMKRERGNGPHGGLHKGASSSSRGRNISQDDIPY
ncbi:hypothetical protein M3616_11085 [Bacillus velezensis]|uniref:hypothetical protein n=1 Tax=Bacillus amyloliquefaciens group TaxID=1938374 RepID=UPI0006A58607|nr:MULTISPECIES: hypothetical protein [Bacillus amyloliquefaciens group]KOC79013.1 hypothetical protein AKJ10_18940 [Bacillus velezensis]KSW04545.1 hypothetical protein AR442_16905 [Bacillus velezensis]MCA1231406.1 hypothetical protein [Bacillus velezensis]MCA1309506.1 hypothetical protein [Bacillus velezensis]MCA1329201.1 hypothetical protein [Bacillus velezensis]